MPGYMEGYVLIDPACTCYFLKIGIHLLVGTNGKQSIVGRVIPVLFSNLPCLGKNRYFDQLVRFFPFGIDPIPIVYPLGDLIPSKFLYIHIRKSGITGKYETVLYMLQSVLYKFSFLYKPQFPLGQEHPVEFVELQLKPIKRVFIYPFQFHGKVHHFLETFQMFHNTIVV